MLTKSIYRINTILIRVPACCFWRNWPVDPKIHMDMPKQYWKKIKLEHSHFLISKLTINLHNQENAEPPEGQTYRLMEKNKSTEINTFLLNWFQARENNSKVEVSFFKDLFIFIYFWLHWVFTVVGFLSLWQAGATLCCSAPAFQRSGFSCWGAWGKEYVKAVHCHPAYVTYMQSTSWGTLGWMKHKLESRLLGEISTTSDMQMTPPLRQKAN